MKGRSRAKLIQNVPATYWRSSIDELWSCLATTPNGLSSRLAKSRLKVVGPNILAIHEEVTLLSLLVRQFANPLILILLFAAVVSLFARELTDAAVILAIVVGSGLISFGQERSAGNAIAKLRKRLTHQVRVVRDGREEETPAASIVPGDIIVLSAGSLIPADGVVFEAQDFFVSEAVLTGEPFPVEKRIGEVKAEGDGLSDRTNCVFMGTSVRSGVARAVVVVTGRSTEYGKIADRLSFRPPETEFERGIRRFGLLLSRIMIGLVVAVFAINVVSQKPPIDSLLFAIALAVGISPELLPAIISINLAKGARTMARRGVIVRRLEAIENLGSMDVLCTDKTGTLTEGVVKLDSAVDAEGRPSDSVFRLSYLNAYFQTGLANPLDEAILSKEYLDLSTVSKIGEIPYDFSRKRLSVIVNESGNETMLVTKGALDSVLDVCTHRTDESGSITEIAPADLEEISERFRKWSGRGFRVLGIATKRVAGALSLTRADERELVFQGFLLFFDPPKEDAMQAIGELGRLQVKLKILTGDNRHVSRHVAENVGLASDRLLSGGEITQLSDEALWHAVEHTDLFVEIDPNQKERILRALQHMGHVVGYMGDGINDAPSLHDADVGISVEGAVDVAREAADIVLLRKGLGVVRQGIEEGRITFANSLKYIFTTTSANFGNMFSMALTSLFLPFLPLVAKQILLNNFLSDIPAIGIASDNVDPESLCRPHRWNIALIRNFMIVFGLISSVFDLLLFGLLIFLVRATEEEFRTGWFIESLLTELLIAMIVRTRRPFYRSRPGRLLWVSTVVIAAVALAIPYVPYAHVFGFVPLPWQVMMLIGVITALYLVATEAAKRIFYSRFEIDSVILQAH